MKAFIVGSDQSADYVLQHESISGKHCEIEPLEDGTLSIRDLDSSNGTFINQRRIRRTILSQGDEIKLGKYSISSEELIGAYQSFYREHKTDYKEEYQQTLGLFKEFQDKKDKIIDKPKTAIYARLGIIVLLAIAYMFTRNNLNVLYTIFIASAAIITILSGIFNRSPVKKNEEIDKLLLAYEDKLVCPKCSSQMLNHGYSYWVGKTSCNNGKCDAILQ
jgi:pSer/pThr/pTyr-binding forkhead associated (FHA) protein